MSAGKWLEIFIEQYGDTNDYNDSEEVMGWLGAALNTSSGTLSIQYESGEDNSKVIECYRLVRIADNA